MSRDDGFDVADVATGHLDDPKVKKLWRLLGDQEPMSHALTLHMATLLASWRHGCRVTVTEAAPVWLDPTPALVEALVEAELLDRSGRIPARSWRGWFGPAHARKKARQEAGRVGGIASGKARERPLKQPLTIAEPVRPSDRSVLTDRSDRRAHDPAKGGMGTIRDALIAAVKP